MILTYNIFTEHNYGLYEEPEVASLDPLTDPLRYNPFHDSFWDIEEEDPIEH
jgi:hypothetical protein